MRAWYRSEDTLPDHDEPVITGSKRDGIYYNILRCSDGVWYQWDRTGEDGGYSMEWIQTDAPEYWTYYPAPPPTREII